MLPGTVATTDGAERIGVFGGTFDPIHVAHVVSAVEARRSLSLDRVVIRPLDPEPEPVCVAAGVPVGRNLSPVVEVFVEEIRAVAAEEEKGNA